MAFPQGWHRQTLTNPAAKAGSGGVTDYTGTLYRANLDDAVCDPSGPHAQADAGDLRVTTGEDGTGLITLDVIAFELDSSTGAGDAQVHIAYGPVDFSSTVDDTLYLWWHPNGSGTETQPAAGTGAYAASVNGFWPKGGGADRTSNGNDGTAKGGVAVGGATGPNGEAVTNFDGSNDYIDCGNDASFDIGTGDWSAGACFATTDTATGVILSKRQQVDLQDFPHVFLRINGNGTLTAQVASSVGGYRQATSPLAYNDGDLHQVDAVWDSSAQSLKLYVDGAEVAENTVVVGTVGSLNKVDIVSIGAQGVPNSFFDGIIGRPYWDTSALTAADITTHYNNTNAPAAFLVPGEVVVWGRKSRKTQCRGLMRGLRRGAA